MNAPFLWRAYSLASVVRTCESQTSIVVGGFPLGNSRVLLVRTSGVGVTHISGTFSGRPFLTWDAN